MVKRSFDFVPAQNANKKNGFELHSRCFYVSSFTILRVHWTLRDTMEKAENERKENRVEKKLIAESFSPLIICEVVYRGSLNLFVWVSSNLKSISLKFFASPLLLSSTFAYKLIKKTCDKKNSILGGLKDSRRAFNLILNFCIAFSCQRERCLFKWWAVVNDARDQVRGLMKLCRDSGRLNVNLLEKSTILSQFSTIVCVISSTEKCLFAHTQQSYALLGKVSVSKLHLHLT